MWFDLGCDNLICLFKSESSNHTICVTDLICIWKGVFNDLQLTAKFKIENPQFEVSDKVAVEKVVKLFSKDGSGTKRQIEKNGNELLVTASSQINKFLFKISLTLHLAEPYVLYNEFTSHIYNFTKIVQEREQRLVKIIHAKDAELEEYRLEGVEIKRPALVTAQFNFEAFEKDTLEESSSTEPCHNLSNILNNPLFANLVEASITAPPKMEINAEVAEVKEKVLPLAAGTGDTKKPKNWYQDAPVKDREVPQIDQKRRKITPRNKLKL